MKSYREAKVAFRSQYVRDCLAETGGNVSRAAKLAGLDRAHFYKLMREAGMEISTPERRAVLRSRFLGVRDA